MKLLNKIFKVNLFISSYIPLYFLIFIQNMEQLNLESILKTYMANIFLWSSVLCISVISLLFLVIFFNGNYTKIQRFDNVKSIDNDILNYFITYIIPLTTVDITKSTSMLINFMIFFVIGIYYIQSDLMHLNILLIFMNYKVFEDGNNNIIISKHDLDYFKRNEEVLCKKIGNSKIYIVR